MYISDKNKCVISFLTERRYRVLRHITLISAFITLHQCARTLLIIRTDQLYSMHLVTFSGVLYINIYLLMPFFFKGRYLQYLGMVVITILGELFLMNCIKENFFEPYRIADDIHKFHSATEYAASTIFIIPIVLATSTARLMQRWIRNMERYRELDKLTVDMELAALKNQINPHFLFNMLNNVNVLVKKNPDKASAVILKLSDFLRHQLYENNAKTTSLMAETEFLFNFLNLEKIRRDNFKFNITCETPGNSAGNILIPPNIFTTFVENAVKHSVDLSDNETLVDIYIKAEQNRLLFRCTNSHNSTERVKDKQSGLGLSNIGRRLKLLYENNFSLTVDDLDNTFNLNLNIPYDLYNS